MPRVSPSLSRSSHASGRSGGHPAGPSTEAARGSWLVAGLLCLGVVAAMGGIVFQRQQTRRCLGFYGAEAARRITAAPSVELLRVEPGSGPRRLLASSRLDVSHAPGLVHLRRGLVEDANFAWIDLRPNAEAGRTDQASRPLDAWDAAIVFADPAGGGRTVLVIDLDGHGGRLAVVGQPGWIGLGRIAPGLETWIRDTWQRASSAGETRASGPMAAAEMR